MHKSFLLLLCCTTTAVLSVPQYPPQQQYPQPPPPPQQPQYPPPAPPPPPPQPQYHVPERNCTVDFEKADSEVCVPTLNTVCAPEQVTFKAPVEAEKCLTITTTNCRAEIKTEEVEICVFVYEKKELQAPAKVPDVRYTKRCDTAYVSVCQKAKPKYGGYGKEEEECKEVPQETCFNKPQTESKETTVTVTVPEPKKKCETKKVTIPDVICQEEKEERCFKLVSLQEAARPIEKCTTTLAEPRCNKVSLNLPSQTCVEELKEYTKQQPQEYPSEQPQQQYPSNSYSH